HFRGRQGLRRDGARARGVGGRAARRHEPARPGRAPQASRQGEAARRGGRLMMQPRHFLWRTEAGVGVVTLNRPERKNPLTFESYGELRDLFRQLGGENKIKTVVLTGAGGNF